MYIIKYFGPNLILCTGFIRQTGSISGGSEGGQWLNCLPPLENFCFINFVLHINIPYIYIKKKKSL